MLTTPLDKIKAQTDGISPKVYGAVVRKGEAYYTYLKKLFDALGNRQREYNWLITDSVCYPEDPETDAMLNRSYCWLSGDELTALIETEDFQWIWAVLSAFDKSEKLSDILEYDLPRAVDYGGFWNSSVSMQHPLAKVEIVPWDSAMTMIFSHDKSIIDRFRAAYPQSEDFEDYLNHL